MQLVVSGQVVHGCGTNSCSVEEETEGHIASTLLLTLGKQVTVGVVLHFAADVSWVFHFQHYYSILINYIINKL